MEGPILENDTLLIRHATGYFACQMSIFFPTSKARLKKLYSSFLLIAVKPAEDYVDLIVEHIDGRLSALELQMEQLANDYAEARTAKAELEEVIRSGRWANGVRLTQSEAREARRRKKELTGDVAGLLSGFRQTMRKREQLWMNRSYLLELDGRKGGKNGQAKA